MTPDGGFYEEDEPIEDIRAAYDAGAKGHMRAPRDLNQRAAGIVGQIIEGSESAVMSGRIDSRHGGVASWGASNSFQLAGAVQSNRVADVPANTFTNNSVTDGTVPDGKSASVTVAG